MVPNGELCGKDYRVKLLPRSMGSMECDRYHKTRTKTLQYCSATTVALLLFVLTNSVSILLFTGAGASLLGRDKPTAVRLLADSAGLLAELNATQHALFANRAELTVLHSQLGTANSLIETLLADMARQKQKLAAAGLWQREPTSELKMAIGPHKLPRGFTPNLGSDELFPTLGQACHRFQDELEQYTSYTAGGECPSDESFAQRLMLKGCEPLPRRRCRPHSPVGYIDPTPLPESLWAIPPDTSIVWDAYTCKNYSCLVNRGNTKGHYDCKDCFNLQGREKYRWMRDDLSSLDYSIDAVLSLKPKGTVRIGLDIGGGSGTFAARMRERGVTVVTTSMNFDGPFNSFIASRGLVPMHVSVAHRLPFFDNTLDVVHSMHVLSNWIPDVMLEFALFDIYRVLRPGGLFWLDHFFCLGTQLNVTYVPMFDRIGFKKVRWNAGRKLDRGIVMNEWYLSALLEKPMT